MDRTSAREAFVALASREDEAIDLARAALYVAAEERPDLDIDAYVRRLDALAERVAPSLQAFRSPRDALAEMRALFQHEGFRGNTEDYLDPRNSFLDQVLERRIGIPITLAIVYLEVGWRCGLPLAGVGFPGHFLVKYVGPQTSAAPSFSVASEPEGSREAREHYIDCFEGAREVTVDELRERLPRMFGPTMRLRPEHLAATSRRQILVRLNANLKTVYTDRGDLGRALAAVERILVLTPDALEEIRDRGLLFLGLRAYRRAITDLERYLTAAPNAPDAKDVREQLEIASRERARLN